MSELLQAARAASADGPGSQSGMNGSFQSADGYITSKAFM